MPSRRRLREPLHPPNRPPPAGIEDASSLFVSVHQGDSSSSMPPPSTPASGKKRGWSSTISRSSSSSLTWEQTGPSSSGPPHADNELPTADFSFRSGMGFPTSTSTGSLASIPSASSSMSFTSFQQQTPAPASPSSFRTAADPDESSCSARHAIFTRGSRSASVTLRETSQAIQDANEQPQDPPRKRRRGLAGAIVDTALNAALYTGAAALTAYSLWSSWGQSANGENQIHHLDAGPEADMGQVISPYKGKDVRQASDGLEDAPPPYCENHTPSRDDYHQQQKQQERPATPQSNSARTRKVFVSSQRNRRRTTFLGSKASRQSTPRQALADAYRNPVQSASPRPVQDSNFGIGPQDRNVSTPLQEQHDAGDDDDDEDDEMLSRFEAKMNALIAEGQAALNSTPVLHDSDLREIDTPSPSLGLRSITQQRLDSPFAPPSVARSTSHPDHLPILPASESRSFLPEPVKRTFGTPTHGLRHSNSAFDIKFQGKEQQKQGQTSPFAFGATSTSSSAAGSPSVRAAVGRRVTDFGGAAGRSSPQSRIPRSTSTLQARKLIVEQRPSPF